MPLFIHYPSLVLETFHARFPVSVKCYRKKNGITSQGSVLNSSQSFSVQELLNVRNECFLLLLMPYAKISGSFLGSKGRQPTNSNWSLFVDVSHSQLARETAAVYFALVSTLLLSRVRMNIYHISRESIFASTEFSMPSTRFKQLQPRIRSFKKIKDIFETSFQHFCSKWPGIIIPKRPQHNNRAVTG